jgi:hypothetical protein
MMFFTLVVAVPANGQTTSTNNYQIVHARIQAEIAAWRALHTNTVGGSQSTTTTTTTTNAVTTTTSFPFQHPGTGKYGWLVNPAPAPGATNAFTYYPGKVRKGTDPIPNR